MEMFRSFRDLGLHISMTEEEIESNDARKWLVGSFIYHTRGVGELIE